MDSSIAKTSRAVISQVFSAKIGGFFHPRSSAKHTKKTEYLAPETNPPPAAMQIRTPDDFFNLPPEKQREQLELLLKPRKYGLYWDDSRHQETVVARCKDEMPILHEAEDRRIRHTPPAADLFDTPDRPQPTHLVIEGDNYHALSVLGYTHRAKIDLIYIDPPYNTGNKDFRYNDHFVDKEDGDRHTKWLSFMHRRLELAKHLLKDTGVIFISIDDNEVAQLKLLCDRVFGEGNFRNSIVVRRGIKNVQAQFEEVQALSVGHEYIHFYSKTPTFKLSKLEKKLDAKKDGKWDTFWRGTDRPTMRYEIFGKKPDSGQWRWEEERSKKAISNYNYYLENFSSEISIDEYYLDSLTANNEKLDFLRQNAEGIIQYYVPPKDSKLASDNWMDILLSGSFAGFQTEKNVELLERLVDWFPQNAIILDFFAGSGTTGHAVLEMNKQDNGRRQFILVTNNEVTDRTRRQLENEGKTEAEIEEMGICRAVTYPRLQKVIEGYTNPKGEKVPGTGGKLRYFQTDFVAVSDNTVQASYNLRDKCAEMICIRENVFDRVAPSPDWGRAGEGAAFEVFQDFDRQLALLYDDAPEHVAALKKHFAASEARERILYVFTLGTEISPALTAEFEGVRLESIPARIIDLYKRYLRDAAKKRGTAAHETYDEETAEPENISPDAQPDA